MFYLSEASGQLEEKAYCSIKERKKAAVLKGAKAMWRASFNENTMVMSVLHCTLYS